MKNLDYYQKKIFQETIFPSGLGYDAKTENYRTSEINPVFESIRNLVQDYIKKKTGTLKILMKVPAR